MKIPASKIELATSQEPSRYTLQAVKLDIQMQQFVATDGHILAAIPAEVSSEDHAGLISLDTMKALRGLQKEAQKQAKHLGTSADVPVQMNGKVSAEWMGVKIEHAYVEGSFPNYEQIKPKMEGSPTITLDVAMLTRLAQALDAEATPKKAVVSLWIKDAYSGVGVKVSNDKGAWGVIMPCHLAKR